MTFYSQTRFKCSKYKELKEQIISMKKQGIINENLSLFICTFRDIILQAATLITLLAFIIFVPAMF